MRFFFSLNIAKAPRNFKDQGEERRGPSFLKPLEPFDPFRDNICFMTVVLNVFAVLLGILGLLFVIGFQGQIGRLIIGLILFGGGVVLFIAGRMRPKQTTMVQKIDLSGDVSAQELKCKNCGSTLTNKSVTVKAGAIFISCEFCGTQYQLEEAPKW
jgi:hypothetical protein